MENIKNLRAETLGCQHKIHLNNAGASLPPQQVIQSIQDYFDLENRIGGYEAMMEKAEQINEFYTALSQMLHCQPHNIAHATSATDAYSKALSSIVFKEGDVILTTDDDYVSNQIAFFVLQKRHGIKLIRAAKNEDGGVNVDSVAELIKKHRPKLVAVTHIPTNSGLIQDVEAIGELCAKNEILYLVDACQSAGQMPLDVTKIKCDFLTATFRKFLRGPRGMGFLYASDKVLKLGLEPIFPDLSAGVWTGTNDYELAQTAKRFEIWERNYSLIMGATTAVNYALNLGLDNIQKRVQHLANYTRNLITETSDWRVLDQGKKLCGIVTAHRPNCDLEKLKQQFSKKNINVSFATKTNAFIDMDEKGVDWTLRIAPHYYNLESEIEEAIKILST